MSTEQLSLAELNEISNLCAVFYAQANAENDISRSFDENATDAERDEIMSLFSDIQLMQSGVYDPGPYVLMGAKATEEDELKDMARKQIKFTDLYTEIVARTVSADELAAHMDDSASAETFDRVDAPALAAVCR